MDDYLKLLVELHRGGHRQGPGGDEEVGKILELAGLSPTKKLNIADIGCGTGAASVFLARHLDAHITAVDLMPEFVEVLQRNAAAQGLSEKIHPMVGSMEELPFTDGEFDVLWSEGAIYNMGFEKGVSNWQRFLKPGGLLVLSEITWLTLERPAPLQAYWDAAYPEIDTAAGKIAVLERAGFSPLAYFFLPQRCWLDNYYRPLQAGYPRFLQHTGNSEAARAVVSEQEEEIALYEQYSEYFSYGVYIARKPG